MDSASVGSEKANDQVKGMPRSGSVVSKGSVVDRFFKMAAHATQQDRAMADQKYKSVSDALDGNSDGTPPVWEEEIFVTCASFGDVDDGDDECQDETSLVGSIRVMDGQEENAVVPRNQIPQLDVEALKEQICTENLDMLCVSKDDVIDDTSQVIMDSDSWERFVEGEEHKEHKKARFRWFLSKSKRKEATADTTPSIGSNGSSNSSTSPNQNGLEMVLCGNTGAAGAKAFSGTKKHQKRTSSWYPRLVRRTRMNKKIMMSTQPEDTQGLIDEQVGVVDVEPVAKHLKSVGETSDKMPEGEENEVETKSVLSSKSKDEGDKCIDTRPLVGLEDSEEKDAETIKSTPEASKEEDKQDVLTDDATTVSSVRSSKRSHKEKCNDDNTSVISARSRKSVETAHLEDESSVTPTNTGGNTEVPSLCSQISQRSKAKTEIDWSKSVCSEVSRANDAASKYSRKPGDTESVASNKSSAKDSYLRTINSTINEEVADSKSIATQKSNISTGTDSQSIRSRHLVHESKTKSVDESRSVGSKKSGIEPTNNNVSDEGTTEDSTDAVSTKEANRSDDTTATSIHSESGTANDTSAAQKKEDIADGSVQTSQLEDSTADDALKSDEVDIEETEQNEEIRTVPAKEEVEAAPATTSPNRAVGEEVMKSKPLRRFVSELLPSRNRRAKSAVEEDEILEPPKATLDLRRVSSDIPKSDLSKEHQSSKKGRKPIEISGSHLFQPCPSDITEGTDDGECKSILRAVCSRDEAMETIDESRNGSEKQSDSEGTKENQVEDQKQSGESVKLDADEFKSSTTKDSTPSAVFKATQHPSQQKISPAESDKQQNENPSNTDSQPEEIDSENASTGEKKAGVTFGVGVFDYVMRRISSDVLHGQNVQVTNEDEEFSSVQIQKSRSEFPTRSAEATKYLEKAKPFDVEEQEVGSVNVCVDGTIIAEAKQETECESQESLDRSMIAAVDEEETIEQTVDTQSKLTKATPLLKERSLLGSIGGLFAKKGAKKNKATSASDGDDGVAIMGEKVVEENPKEAVKSVVEPKSNEVDSVVGEQTQSEGTSTVVCANGVHKITGDNSELSKCDNFGKEAALPKKKWKPKLTFWKRDSKKGVDSESITNPKVEELKYDIEEDHSRGGGSQREGPVSDKDSASGREASDIASVNSDKSTISKTEYKPSLLMKLQNIPVPKASTPKFERPMTQVEGLQQMQSMRNSDPSEVENRLDEKLDLSQMEPTESVAESNLKKKGPEGILKKNNRFSASWRKKPKVAARAKPEKGDDDSTATPMMVSPSANEQDGEEFGFEIVPLVDRIEV